MVTCGILGPFTASERETFYADTGSMMNNYNYMPSISCGGRNIFQGYRTYKQSSSAERNVLTKKLAN